MSKAYSSNLTQWQWELIEPLSCRAFYGGFPAERAPLIPAAKQGGRSREVEIWSVLNAIFYLLTQYDAGKKIKGRKRFMTVDTLGLVLSVSYRNSC
jgi:hypothetical protein